MAFSNPQTNVEQLGLNHGMSVADLGAGVGAYTVAAAHAVGDTGRVYAVEVQKEFLTNIKDATSREGLSNVEVIWGDIERAGKTKIKDGAVGAVIVANVLFQTEDKVGTLNEIKRILKPRGKVLVVDWEGSFAGLGPQADKVFPHDEAKQLFEDNGFSFLKNISAGDNHYGFIAIKS